MNKTKPIKLNLYKTVTIERSYQGGRAEHGLKSVPVQRRLSDQPFVDNTLYGSGKDDSITDTTENYAITHRSVTIGETIISYTAHAGHLVTYDQDSA